VSAVGVGRPNTIALGVVALAIAGAPFVFSGYQLSILVTMGIYAIAATGLALLVGQARQISLGHAAFFGLGAYGSGLLSTHFGWSPWLTLPIAIAITVAVALPIGIPVLRLEGHYLAMATLGLGIVFNVVLREWTTVTAGPSGFSGIPPLALPILGDRTETRSLLVVWGALLVAVWLALRVTRSRRGRALRAIGASEIAAELIGLDAARRKLEVFALSAAYAALAGGLYAHYVAFLSPEPFGFLFSLELLVMAAVGGLTSVWGGIIGAGTIVILTEVLRHALPPSMPGASGELEPILFGLALMAIMILRPTGLAGIGRLALARLAALRRGGQGA
jgi:branched-chain amino acid transport system permease protein